MTFRAQGRARRVTRLFHVSVAIPTGIVIGRFRSNLGVLGMAAPALLRRLPFLIGVVALFAVLQRIGMLFVPELNPLVHIRFVKPGMLDGERILLTENALQDEQGSKENNRSDNGNEFFVHETLTSFLSYSFFHKVPSKSYQNQPRCQEKNES